MKLINNRFISFECDGIQRRMLAMSTCLLAAVMAMAVVPATQASSTAVADKLELVSRGLAGSIGVAAREVGGGAIIAIRAQETFPMASTYKVAIAMALLRKVDRGELELEQLVEVKQDMMVAGDNVIQQNFVRPGIQLSVANLIDVMITNSDNTATDTLFEVLGGPPEVTRALRDIGISDQRVDRNTAEILRDFYQLPGLALAGAVPGYAKADPGLMARLPDPNPAFEQDPRDQSSPSAMLELLLAIDSGGALSVSSRDFLLAAMTRTRSSKDRLRGLLPRGTPVAHKTGTIGGVANDVGFVTLPDGRRFAAVIFTKSSTTPMLDRDRAAAEISRTLYDYYFLKQ
ncbi:class A beta-lactamase [Porticoccaceae bacterium]|nr:class A beta-lactamase [Porticoccaceae bacterium]MDC0003200.1 class A beta-lactamase [Porticoccaceae bacterium]